jgi:hypothetical protein
VVHQPSADRGIFSDGERAISAAFGPPEMTPVAQRGELAELLDQRCVPRHERAGVHEDDTFTAFAKLIRELDVLEVQVLHGTSPIIHFTYDQVN